MDRFKEGTQINRSLLTLGTVIHKLSEVEQGQHIPYRDSTLTKVRPYGSCLHLIDATDDDNGPQNAAS